MGTRPLLRYLLPCAFLTAAIALALGQGEPAPLSAASDVATTAFSGHVYSGSPPETATPLRGVTVRLYGSNDANVWTTLLATAVTGADGAFTLQTNQAWPYFHLVEQDPLGYVSTGAQAGQVGTAPRAVVNYNWIRYQQPSPETYTGNVFWDRPVVTETPTPTEEATPTATSTYIPKPTCTSTPTPTNYTPTPESDLEIYKEVLNPDPVPPGSQVQFVIHVVQRGPAPAPNVIFTDTLPSGFSFVPSGSDPRCTRVASRPPNDVVRCALGTLSPSRQPYSVSINALADPSACGRITNAVQVSSGMPDPRQWNNSDTAGMLVSPCNQPAVLVTKMVTPPSPVQRGSVITFTIEVTNIGNTELTGVRLTDRYDPSELQFLSASHEPTQMTQGATESSVVWANLAAPSPFGFGIPLAPGARFTVRALFRAFGIWGRENCAVVKAGEGPLLEQTDCIYIFTTAVDPFYLGKKVTQPQSGPAVVNGLVGFMVELGNYGSQPITFLRLRDTYDRAFLAYLSSAYNPDDPADDGTLDWADLTRPFPYGMGRPLNPGQLHMFSMTFRAKAATSSATQNCLQAWYRVADGPEQTAGPVCAPMRIVAQSGPRIEVLKSVLVPSEGLARAGYPVQFSFIITNTGTTVLTNLALTDAYDTACLQVAPLGFGNLDPDDLTDDGQLTWAHWLGLTSLAPGESLRASPGVLFQGRAGTRCAPTVNRLSVVARDQQGRQATGSSDAPISVVVGELEHIFPPLILKGHGR